MHSTSTYILKLRGSSLETGRGVQDPIKISGTATYRLSILAKGCPALLYVVYCQLAIVKISNLAPTDEHRGPTRVALMA